MHLLGQVQVPAFTATPQVWGSLGVSSSSRGRNFIDVYQLILVFRSQNFIIIFTPEAATASHLACRHDIHMRCRLLEDFNLKHALDVYMFFKEQILYIVQVFLWFINRGAVCLAKLSESLARCLSHRSSVSVCGISQLWSLTVKGIAGTDENLFPQ